MTNIHEGILLGMGNPLLDITAHVSTELLDKYKLEANNAILAAEEHLEIFPHIVSNYNVTYVAGGATQNSIRVAQWMLQFPKATTYFGSIGKDSFGAELRRCAEADNVRVEYMVSNDVPTGKCAVLVTGHKRSLVAHLAAAEKFTLAHLDEPQVWKLVEQAKFFYVSCFFLTHSTDSALRIAKHCVETNKVFSMNLAAPFLSMFFKSSMEAVIPYWDIVFGNEAEADAFAAMNGWQTKDVKEIAKLTAELPKANSSRPRLVVYTQGTDPVITYCNGVLTETPVTVIPDSSIVDTNGAGDAFVGGFLSQYVQGKELSECVRAGSYAASVIIQHSGCTYPALPSFK